MSDNAVENDSFYLRVNSRLLRAVKTVSRHLSQEKRLRMDEILKESNLDKSHALIESETIVVHHSFKRNVGSITQGIRSVLLSKEKIPNYSKLIRLQMSIPKHGGPQVLDVQLCLWLYDTLKSFKYRPDGYRKLDRLSVGVKTKTKVKVILAKCYDNGVNYDTYVSFRVQQYRIVVVIIGHHTKVKKRRRKPFSARKVERSQVEVSTYASSLGPEIRSGSEPSAPPAMIKSKKVDRAALAREVLDVDLRYTSSDFELSHKG